MRAYKRYGKEGFTLVELMIVVAIIGVLAALAIYGVRRYLASAKTSEAKNTVGAISRAGAAAYERETVAAELLAEGGTSSTASNSLCAGAPDPVPSAGIPKGTKYQPNSATGQDFEAGDATTGWKCLRFSMNQPHYYQYHYVTTGTVGALTGFGGTLGFVAAAAGDLDGDSVPAYFGRTGEVNDTSKTIRLATQIQVIDEFE